MSSMNLAAVAFAAVALCSGPAIAAPVKINKTVILAEHNRYRAKVGVPPLAWSDGLAKGAQHWADTMAALDRMQHSGTSGVGENLAYRSGPNASPLRTMIGLWEREAYYFRPGTFPS